LTKKLNDFSEAIFDTGMKARSTGLAAAMIRGRGALRARQLRRQHFFQSFSLGRRRATETLNPETAAADLTKRMQLFCAVARYPTPPAQGLQSWAMATLMLAAKPRPANPVSRSLSVWRVAAFPTCGSIIKPA
jgi:hypothetical protein